MPDRFVDLQSKLRTIENNVERAFGALLSFMQRNRLFRDAARVLNQPQLVDQLVAFVLPLSTEGIRIRPLLNLVVRKRIRSIARACGILCLMDVGSLRRHEPLLLAIEIEIAFSEGNSCNGTQFGVNIQQKS